MAFELTDQQKNILSSFSNGKNLKINAFAWTGKTTMLRLLVEHNPQKKFLVLVFNRSVSEELKKKFPKNAEISTINAYAYNKVKTIVWDLNVVEEKNIILKIIEQFKISYTKAKIITDVFSMYCDSDIIPISWRTMKEIIETDALMTHYFMIHKKTLSYDYVAEKINKIFKQMIKWNIPFTHGWYLKYFQIFFEKYFRDSNRYDAVMLDEWQDTNRVSLDIFKKFEWQKVIVWDTHQWIYGRRWAINAMEDINFDSFYITKSFRINKDTAEKWNIILKNYKSETKPLESFFSEWWIEQWTKCTIFRTNAWIIHYLFKKFNEWGIKFRCTRKLEEIYGTAIDFEKLLNYYETWDKQYLKWIVQWRILYLKGLANNWEELWKLLNEKIDDYDLLANYALVWTIWKWFSWSSSEILLAQLNERENKKWLEWNYNLVSFMYEKSLEYYDESCDNTLSTAHSVKWLEFDEVVIEDDFPSIYDKLCEKFVYNKKWAMSVCSDETYYNKINDTIRSTEELFFNNEKNIKSLEMRAIIEEVNLMYVAITRAIKKLEVCSSWVNELLTITRDYFKEHLVYKTIEHAWSNIKLCKLLINTDFKSYFNLNKLKYELWSAYIFDAFKNSVNWKKRKRVRKNDKWLVITYKYKKSELDDIFKFNKKSDKIRLFIDSNWEIYKAKAKLDRVWNSFESLIIDEDENFWAWCFDIKESVLWDWKLIIKNSKKDWIVIELNKLNFIEEDTLETWSIILTNENKAESLKILQDKANTIRKWLIRDDKPYYYFIDYNAAGKIHDNMLTEDQKQVLFFKRGVEEYRNMAVKRVTNFVKENFWNRNNFVFVCVPASKKSDNIKRYREFSKQVCKDLWIENGFNHIKIINEKWQKHKWNKSNVENWLDFDKEFFKGKYIIIFDDVITKWETIDKIWDILSWNKVWAKPFLGITIWRTVRHNIKDPLL